MINDLLVKHLYFINGLGKTLNYSEYPEGATIRIDTEDADNSSVTIRGNRGLASVKNNHCTITWAIDDTIFIILYEGELSEALLIADGVKKIL